MRIHRFYTAQTMNAGEKIALDKSVAHHCVQVLRYQIGNSLVLFNGDGTDYHAVVESIDGKKATVEIISSETLNNESPLKIHLYQSLAKGDKMDLVVQKSIELGVSEITPIITERSNVKLDLKRMNKKVEHWQKVAISACEQSGRARLPIINPITQLPQVALSNQKSIYLEPKASIKISQLNIESDLALFIGPEGGFSEKDLSQLTQLGAKGISLGPRILRTETAGLSTIAIVQSHFGDL